MAQVLVTGPNEGDPVDPALMQAVLLALAAGINNVDATQLTADSVTEPAIRDDEITLNKLKGGAFLKIARMRNSEGAAPGSNIVFDGTAGTYKAPRVPDSGWAAIKNATYDWRGADGNDLSLTATRDIIVVYFAMTRARIGISGSGAEFSDYSLGIWDKGLSADNITSGLVAQATVSAPPSMSIMDTHVMIGLRELSAGQTAIPKLAIYVDYEGTCTVTHDKEPYLHALGILALPK